MRTSLSLVFLAIAGSALLLVALTMPAAAPRAIQAQEPGGETGPGLTLHSGFNELYWPGGPIALTDALAGIEDQLVAVFRWRNVEQDWLTYSPLLPPSLNTLSEFEPGGMYWIGVRATIDTIIPLPAPDPLDFAGFGTSTDLDALATACADGDLAACDDLFFDSPSDSGYEAYGDTCAGRQPADSRLFCIDAFPYS